MQLCPSGGTLPGSFYRALVNGDMVGFRAALLQGVGLFSVCTLLQATTGWLSEFIAIWYEGCPPHINHTFGHMHAFCPCLKHCHALQRPRGARTADAWSLSGKACVFQAIRLTVHIGGQVISRQPRSADDDGPDCICSVAAASPEGVWDCALQNRVVHVVDVELHRLACRRHRVRVRHRGSRTAEVRTLTTRRTCP